MKKVITFNDIDEYLICPRKYFIEFHEHEGENLRSVEDTTRFLLNIHSSVENPVLSIESFGKVLVSEPDLVVRDKNGWKIILKKSAKSFKKKYLLEAAYHGYIFSSAGYHITEVLVISDFFLKTVDWKDGVPHLFSLIQEIANIQDGHIPLPKPNNICKVCQHVPECARVLIENEDLLAIHGVNEKMKSKLAKCGILKLSDLAKFSTSCPKYLDERLVKKALSLLEGKEIILSNFEKLENGVFIDIEFHSLKHFDFLFGILENDKYTPYLCRNEGEERLVFEKLLNHLIQLDCPIYHYGPYEPTRFQELTKKWKELEAQYQKIKRNFLDLYQFISKHVALPLFTYSLKSVARHFGFVFRTQMDAPKASRYFQRWLLTQDDSYLFAVLQYNEDDTRAAKLIVDKLNLLKHQSVTL